MVTNCGPDLPFFRYNQISVCIHEEIKWTRNFQQRQKCYCSCDWSGVWTDFVLESSWDFALGARPSFAVLSHSTSNRHLSGPLHFQYLRRLPPVSELNTCITVGRSGPRSRRSRPTRCLAPGRVAMARPAAEGPRFRPADRDTGASGAVPALVSKGTTQDAVAPSAQARSASRPPDFITGFKNLAYCPFSLTWTLQLTSCFEFIYILA